MFDFLMSGNPVKKEKNVARMSGDQHLEKNLEGNYKPGFTNEML